MLRFKRETRFEATNIGIVPEEWSVESLGRILTIKYGRGLPERKRKKGSIPVFGSSGIVGYHKKALAKGPGLIIGRKGNIGSVYFSENDFFPIDTVFYSDQVKNARFLFYLLTKINLKQLMSDSAVPGLNIHFLESVQVPYPSFSEQSRIASVLSWFDDLIENKKRQNEVLEKTAMTIFKSWFIDFEPFKDSELVDSELGKIPKTWKVRSIGKIADFRNGLSYKGVEKFSEPTGYLFITLNNVLEGGGFKPEYSWIKSNRIKEHHFLKEGDLIIANTEQTKVGRLVGCPALVTFPYDYKKEKGVYSHHITKITPKDKLYKLFLYLYLKITQQETATFHTGTGVWGLDIENLKRNKLIVIPSKPILERFHNVINPLFKKITINEKQIMVLKQIRDVLLPLLVFGRLRVEEI